MIDEAIKEFEKWCKHIRPDVFKEVYNNVDDVIDTDNYRLKLNEGNMQAAYLACWQTHVEPLRAERKVLLDTKLGIADDYKKTKQQLADYEQALKIYANVDNYAADGTMLDTLLVEHEWTHKKHGSFWRLHGGDVAQKVLAKHKPEAGRDE